MTVPMPTPIYRFLHVDNLETCLRRGGLHAPNHTPKDGLPYKTIHNVGIQQQRKIARIPCGPRGVIHDYVAFYFGYLSPMLLQLKTGRVKGYGEGQDPLIYVVSTAQAVADSGAQFVFSDGHGIAAFTHWYDDLARLDQVDWNVVYERYWADSVDDMDRQRRKQAEFLVHCRCDWSLIHEIAVLNQGMKTRVEEILCGFAPATNRPVNVHPEWYFKEVAG
ncbi:type II toxin-antitoxin system toxin DNA ADP-ribosyl transferase DarT [Thermopirellula anaerolimosa]